MKLYLIPSLFPLLFLSSIAFPNNPCINLHLDDLPIRQRGRIKPLYVHARESIKYLTGKTRPEGQDPLELYCRLSVAKELHTPLPVLSPPIEHVNLRSLLNLAEGEHPSYSALLEKEEALNAARKRAENDHSSTKKSMDRLAGQLALYKDITSGFNWLIPAGGQWWPLSQVLKASTGADDLTPILGRVKSEYVKEEGKSHLIELFYAKSRIHAVSMGFILIAGFLLVLLSRPLPGVLVTAAGLLLQLAAIILRIVISGRAPITNMYETVLFSGFGALLIALIIGRFLRREKIYVLAGLGYNFLCSLMIQFADGMLSGDISPLVPVLRDNFWLSTHVTTVILSYAAFAL